MSTLRSKNTECTQVITVCEYWFLGTMWELCIKMELFVCQSYFSCGGYHDGTQNVIIEKYQCFFSLFWNKKKNRRLRRAYKRISLFYIFSKFSSNKTVMCNSICNSPAGPLGENSNNIFIEKISWNGVCSVKNNAKTSWSLTKSMKKFFLLRIFVRKKNCQKVAFWSYLNKHIFGLELKFFACIWKYTCSWVGCWRAIILIDHSTTQYWRCIWTHKEAFENGL